MYVRFCIYSSPFTSPSPQLLSFTILPTYLPTLLKYARTYLCAVLPPSSHPSRDKETLVYKQLTLLRRWNEDWAAEASRARATAQYEVGKQMEQLQARGLHYTNADSEEENQAAAILQSLDPLRASSSSSSSSRGRENGHSSSSSSGNIDWEKWQPWFRPDCSLCRKEVEELMEEEQQQQEVSPMKSDCMASDAAAAGSGRGGNLPPSSSSAAAAEVAAEAAARVGRGGAGGSMSTTAASASGPAFYPWDEVRAKQQLHDSGQAIAPDHPSPSSSAAASAAGGGGGGDGVSEPNLHGSCYGSWPVPWDCPFKFRRLMWRLMARVKPTALRFWSERVGMCAHATDGKAWYHLVRGVVVTLFQLRADWQEQ
jgi:hypothetical protein